MSTCKEKPRGRRFSQTEGEIPYRLEGYMTQDDAQAALLAGSPSSVTAAVSVEGSTAQTILLDRVAANCRVEAVFLDDAASRGIWDGTVAYAVSSRTPRPPPAIGDKVITFSISRSSAKLTRSISSTFYDKITPGGAVASDGAIIGMDMESRKAEGVEVTFPVSSFTVAIYMTAAQASPEYFSGLIYMADNPLNSAALTVNGIGRFEAGELLFDGYEASERGAEKDWEVKCSFKAAGSKTVNVTFAGDAYPTTITVRGFDAWDERLQTGIANNRGILEVAEVWVHQVYHSSNLAYLDPDYEGEPEE